MTERVLVQWNSNWADEMDIKGFKIYEKKDWKAFKNILKGFTHKFEIYVGTNEQIDYSNGEELLKELKVKNISDEQYTTIKKLFGEEWGFTDFEQALEAECDDEDDDLDDY